MYYSQKKALGSSKAIIFVSPDVVLSQCSLYLPPVHTTFLLIICLKTPLIVCMS